MAFRYIPNELATVDPETVSRFQRELRRDLIQSGRYYIVQTTIDGMAALRATVINPLTTEDHFEGLMTELRARGRKLFTDGC